MKKIIMSFVLPVFISIIIGFIFAKVVYKIYQDDLDTRLSSFKIYLLKNGEYSSYEEMRQDNNYHNYLYYKDDNIYKSIIGITNEESNINKIKEVSEMPLEVEEYYISSGLVNDKMKDYDKQLKNTNDIDKIKEITKNILEIYKENNNITLILTN